jgi:hypothetical protein
MGASMIRTQVELITTAFTLPHGIVREKKVFWVDEPEHRLQVGDILEIAEQPGKLSISGVYMSLPQENITVPHRLGTILSISTARYL